MNIRNTAFILGIFLLLLTGTIFLLEPGQATTNPDPAFNVEVSSFADGNADFIYKSNRNESLDVLMSYNITIDNETVESINNRRVENITQQRPFTVTVEAEPHQEVAVYMKITELNGKTLHNSRHTISGNIGA